MPEKIRWGIISTGNIASRFAEGLAFADGAELVGVGSRSQASADAFGEKYNIPHRYDNYEALAADPNIDAIYIGTPHPYHKENTLLCLENGKAVLCEKPFAMNAQEAAEMVQVAREKGVFLMEAMWTRFLPLFVKIKALLDDDVLGTIRYLTADFGISAGFNPSSRLFAPELGGGALLDLGIYPVSLASFIFRQQPQQIASIAHIGETGVDERTTIQFEYTDKNSASLYCASRAQTPCEAVIAGDKGMLRIHSRWHNSNSMTLTHPGQEPQFISAPVAHDNGYQYEANEVMECLRQGKTESDIMPLDESLAIMQTMDRIQQAWKAQ